MTYCRIVSIHAPHAGRDNAHPVARASRDVSIHAPHAERDTSSSPYRYEPSIGFQSTRPTRGRATSLTACRSKLVCAGFQSTPPTRGATIATGMRWWPGMFQSTRPTRGATGSRGLAEGRRQRLLFQSTRPPRGARHNCERINLSELGWFQSTPPRGGRHPDPPRPRR